jgi:hypothetical protein
MNRLGVEQDLYDLIARMSGPMIDDDLVRELKTIAENSGLVIVDDDVIDQIVAETEIETLWEMRGDDLVDYLWDHPAFLKRIEEKKK